MRSANRGNANNTWNINSSGNVNNNNASNSNRFSPVCVIILKLIWLLYKSGAILLETQRAECLAKAKQHEGDGFIDTDSKPIYSGEFNKVASFEPLYLSMRKCTHGVMWKDSVANFSLNGIEETLKLERQLVSGTYKPRKPKNFKITSPKPRDIISIAFRDRVFQRSLNDNSLYPKIGKSFIYDNCACQKGKGTDFARNRLKCFLQRYYRKNGPEGFILKCDVKGYYPNMSHKAVKDCFFKVIKGWPYQQALTVLDGQYDGKVGYAPGSQMIQIAGIALLNELDHYIKEVLKIKYYLRYMDDFILIHEDRDFLIWAMTKIGTKLWEVKCMFNQQKTRIIRIDEGLLFLGFTFNLTATGKIVMTLDPRNVKRERKKLRRLVTKCISGEILRVKVDNCYQSWRAHASKGNSYTLLQNMDKYYNDLWRYTQ